MYSACEGVGKPGEMSFYIFASLFRLFRIFSKYSIETPNKLNPEEFASFIIDPHMDPDWIAWADTEAPLIN